ncbi:MAG TPA: tRNA dihydrouridine synthase DusB [archaeon]|nr:tRNA dihydrouridine synthase DusB [archaeon]
MDFSNKLILAPMAGITGSIFRRICRRMGADITWTEMVSADGLVRGGAATRELVFFTPEERPLGIQLFGAHPEVIGSACEIIAEFKPDFIDLNFGCPVPKVVKRNGGASLLRNPELVASLVREAVKNARGIPVTAKIRSGWEPGQINYLEVARRLFDAGISALTLHPRTRDQRFAGRSDWSRIEQLKRISPVPIIGSGDVFEPQDALEMFRSTGCDAVMIGRGAMGNPWIFRRARALIAGRGDPGDPSLQERFDQVLEHTVMMVEKHGAARGIIIMRRHFGCYTRGLPESSHLRRELFSCLSLNQVQRIFSQYLERYQCTLSG